MSTSALIRFLNPANSPYGLILVDLSGKVCWIVENISSENYLLERGDLKPGIYFIELTGSRIYRGKIIIE